MADLEPSWAFKADDNLWAAEVSRDGNLIVLGSWDNSAYALDRKGESLWKHKTADYVKGLGISEDGELVVVGSYDRYIYAVKRSGKLGWRYKTENYVRAAAVSRDGEYVAAGSWRGTLYYLDKRGKLLWKHRIGSAILDLATSGDGSIVAAGCEDGTVHVFDIGGTQKWAYKCGGMVTNVVVSEIGDMTIVCAKDTLMVCLDAKGEVLWTFHLGGVSKGLYLVQGDDIAVAFTDNNFIQYVDRKGDLFFMRRLPEEVWEGSIAEDGITVAVATKDNRAMLFELNELASVVLESTQQAIERVVSDGLDVAEAQEMHQESGDMLTDGQFGEAISKALKAQRLATKMHSSLLTEQANDLVEEVEALIAGHPDLDMRKAIRFLTKARRGFKEERLDRSIFYAKLSREAAEESMKSNAPAVEDDLFMASLAEPVETDESKVDVMLGLADEMPEAEEAETATELEEVLAEEVVEEAQALEEDAQAEVAATAEEGSDEAEGSAATAPVDEGEFIETEPPVEAPVVAEEVPAEAEAVGTEAAAEVEEAVLEEFEAEEAYPTPVEDEVCPVCGEAAGTINDRCKACYSDEMMKLGVDQAKKAHKEGLDISALAPDLKAVKSARQARDYDEVIAISERILLQIEDILGEEHVKPKPKKKKKKKRVKG